MSGFSKNRIWQPGPWRPVNGSAAFGAVTTAPTPPRDLLAEHLNRAERMRMEMLDGLRRYLSLLSVNPKSRTPKNYPRPRTDEELGMAILRIAAGAPEEADQILGAIEAAIEVGAHRWSAEARNLVIQSIGVAAARDKTFVKRKRRLLDALRNTRYVPWSSR